jgi:hypothetical protein
MAEEHFRIFSVMFDKGARWKGYILTMRPKVRASIPKNL